MNKTLAPWTDGQRERLRNAVEDGMKPLDIIGLFPDRTAGAVYTKIRYERHRKFINSHRTSGRNNDAPAISDADHIAAGLANEDQDAKFQDAMRAAIRAGLEIFPLSSRNLTCDEFRPVHFDRQAGASYGASPAQLCAELGAA